LGCRGCCWDETVWTGGTGFLAGAELFQCFGDTAAAAFDAGLRLVEAGLSGGESFGRIEKIAFGLLLGTEELTLFLGAFAKRLSGLEVGLIRHRASPFSG
jgi:hypothetical protein